MCINPFATGKRQQATKLQESKEPVYRDAGDKKKTGRRSTVLAANAPIEDVTVAGKKTALGT